MCHPQSSGEVTSPCCPRRTEAPDRGYMCFSFEAFGSEPPRQREEGEKDRQAESRSASGEDGVRMQRGCG